MTGDSLIAVKASVSFHPGRKALSTRGRRRARHLLEFNPGSAMSSSTKNIYDEHIKPLSREQQIILLDLLQTELQNGDDGQRHSILELHGLGKEIWQGVDPKDYVSKLRDEWEERAR